ncbi:hypothetical protein Syun_012838 [Stephania yunnanensis]|uniref:Malic enzyme n=1 Tax=Stephania yunnanensis TaxID=152371 RepID=A0AAP0PFQ8_9MAGN
MWRIARFAAAAEAAVSVRGARWFSAAIPGPCIVHKRGADILHDPWFNKVRVFVLVLKLEIDTGFPLTERDRLGLRGLLPPRIISFEQQYDRFMESFRSLEKNTQGQSTKVVSLAKWRILNRLHDRNETLYYRVLIDNIKDFAPIIYTPTVGLVCQNYSGLFRRPRGMYFSAKDKGEMMSMIYNWPSQQVDMIVLTDGSRILGLGDLGVQGIGIPIGKLDMYVAAAGINPQRIRYLGLRQPRLEGEEYLNIIDEFMEAVYTRWPKAVIQFEDFQMKWAFETLQRYRKRFCMFNDDVQGTAGVAIAGLLGAVRAQGRPLSDFAKQKIVVVGAGRSVTRMTGNDEIHASNPFWLLDKDGLVTRNRKNLDPAAAPFARGNPEAEGLMEGASLVEVVKNVRPDVLLGLSGVGGVFNKEFFFIGTYISAVHGCCKDLLASVVGILAEVLNVLCSPLERGLRLQSSPMVQHAKQLLLDDVPNVQSINQVLAAMRESTSSRPAIFAMSNPTANAECTPADAFKYAGDHIVFASGSPFEDIHLGNGKAGHVNQANNMYLFPGIGLGALLSGARVISDGMLQAASECLASYITEKEIQDGILYPSISSIRDITKAVGAAVVQEAIDEELAEGHGDVGSKELIHMSKDEILEYVGRHMWFPVYSPLVHEK